MDKNVRTYDASYENYYNRMKRKIPNRRNDDTYFKKFLNKLLIQTYIVIILFIALLFIKQLNFKEGNYICNFASENIDKNFDFNVVTSFIGNYFDNNAESMETFNRIKDVVTGKSILKNEVMNNFIYPLDGNIIEDYGEKLGLNNKSIIHRGIDISGNVGDKVQSSSNGVVKEIGENKSVGKYIIIDHGKGIETLYGNLLEVSISKGDNINKGDSIGTIGGNIEEGEPHIHFELMYMGQWENPENYINTGKEDLNG